MPPLRVLFYQDPITDYNTFMWRSPHINIDAPIFRALKAADCDCRMLMDRRFSAMAAAQGIDPAQQIGIEEEEWLALLDDPQENINSALHRYCDFDDGRTAPGSAERRGWAMALSQRLQEAVRRALNGFTPDVIMTWVPSPFLRKLFPAALILYREGCMFTRAPFPLTYYFDPGGAHHRSWVRQFAPQSRSAEGIAQIERLRGVYREAFANSEPFPTLPEQLKAFRKTILVGAQVNNHFSFDATCRYRSQTHMLLDVLNHTPKDCAVLLGQHPGNPLPLKQEEISWLRERYPNFIHQDRFMGKEGVSQHLMMHADAIATGSSTVGWLGTLWGKPLVVTGESQLNAFAQSCDVREIGRVLDAPPPDTRAAAAWLAFHYGIPTAYFARPGWFFQYLLGRYRHWAQHGLAGYFDEPYAPPAELGDAFVKVAEGSLGQLIGAPVGMDARDEALDFTDEKRFGAGWSYCERDHAGHVYRWMDGKEAWLHLPLATRKTYKLTMAFSTHPGCPAQHAVVGAGAQVLAKSRIKAGRMTEVKFTLPAAAVRVPLTRLWIKAEQAAAPAPETRQLSLICQRLAVRG